MPGGASLAKLFEDTSDELRHRALSHSSWVETRTDSYGRLAFLGDSVLGLAVASRLFERFPDADIGELTKILNQAVSGRACADVAGDLGLPEMLTENMPDVAEALPAETLLESERTLASLCEAVIGAAYLEHGYEATEEAVLKAFAEQIEDATRHRMDFKSELQERLARNGETVVYEISSEEGPPHDRRFEIRAEVAGEALGTGEGRSKKEAEQAAAERALEQLRR